MRTHVKLTTLGGLAGAGLLLLSACGGGGTTYGGSSSGGQSAQSGAQSSTGKISVGSTTAGKVLVDPHKMTLYAFAKDSRGHSTCTGACANYWPPVPGADASAGASSAVTAKLGTIKRAGGTTQLTVDGYPMYTYVGDTKPGQATGQGLNLSGGLWWVVAPDGSWVKSAGSSSSGGRGGY